MSRRTVPLLAALFIAIAPASATAAPIFGTADSLDATSEQLGWSASLHSNVSRVLIDVSQPLASYDEAIQSRRDAGMRPQFVIGGLYAGPMPTPAQAVAVYRRWPDAIAISVGNEPELASLLHDKCAYRHTFNRIYKALKRAGAPRVLFGEFAPMAPVHYATELLACGPITADGFAWHAYDWKAKWTGSVVRVAALSRWIHGHARWLHTPRGYSLPLFVTEYGQRSEERTAASRWGTALRLAEKYNVKEIVAYGVNAPSHAGNWNTSLFSTDGDEAPSVSLIRAR